MRRSRIHPQHCRPACAKDPVRIRPIAALILCLILATSLLQACMLAPVVVVGSTTAAGIAMEAERAVTEADKSEVVTVGQDAVAYEGAGKEDSEEDI